MLNVVIVVVVVVVVVVAAAAAAAVAVAVTVAVAVAVAVVVVVVAAAAAAVVVVVVLVVLVVVTVVFLPIVETGLTHHDGLVHVEVQHELARRPGCQIHGPSSGEDVSQGSGLYHWVGTPRFACGTSGFRGLGVGPPKETGTKSPGSLLARNVAWP